MQAGTQHREIPRAKTALGMTTLKQLRRGGRPFRARRRGGGGGGGGPKKGGGGSVAGGEFENRQRDAGATTAASVTNHESQITNHPSRELRASQSPQFDPAAYAAFERSTNDSVARDVHGSISDTLARVMPEGVAEGAARRIGEDIFN